MKFHNIKNTRELSFFESVLVVVLCIVLLPLTIIFGIPILRLHDYCKAVNYTSTKLTPEYAEKTFLIAHRGFRALAPENTLPAYEEAGKAKFWGAENDIHRTKDGVWVLQHDYYTYRMMNKNYHIENTSYDKLLKLHVDNGSNYKDFPNLKIARLENYLEICKKYNMVAVIELKGKKNTEYLYEVVDMVKKYGVEAQYISFNFKSVQTIRELCDSKVFYLIYKIEQKDVELAKTLENCGISFDGNDDNNKSKEAVGMILNAGLEPALWAVDDLKLVENYVDWGVKYITTNQIHY